MSDVNVSVIGGRLTRMPELRTTPSGVAVCDLTIASNRYRKRKSAEGFDTYTAYVRVTLWDDMAERFAKQLKTGDGVLVTGQLVDDNFEKDGQKTSGRLKIDNVSQLNVVTKAKPKAEGDAPEAPEA
jgi:single-strand DNA-binding protein